MEESKNNIVLYIIIAIAVLLFIVLVVLVKKDNKEKASNSNEPLYATLNNRSKFFTVENCINRYLNAITSSNKGNLIKLLDSKYIEDNNINEDNVLTKIDNLKGLYTFKAKKIFYEDNNNYTKYYVYGLLQKDLIDEYDYGEDYYLIIKIDNNNLFSVTPYDGKIFKEAK